MDPDVGWIVKGEIGVRVFPRCGSTTLLRTYSYNQNRKLWMKALQRFIVVRNPWDRLLSAWAMFWPPQDMHMERRGYPPCTSLDDLLTFMLSSPQETMDLHVRSMHSQLEGMAIKGCTLVSLCYMLANPSIEVSPRKLGMHFRKTESRPSPQCSAENYRQWRQLYDADWKMWEQARKIPGET
ncbi:MAG TPA: hypothetical protein ENH62_04490 [Marinobacter sp.]|nr:hypothetical protein [Marinobacter sp.]